MHKDLFRQSRPPGFWLNIITLVFAALSASAAIGAVYMGNRQVDAALEAVTRAERTKYISEFVAAADDTCRELIPPFLLQFVQYKSVKNKDGSVGRPAYTLLEQDFDISDVNKSWNDNAKVLADAANRMSNKARMLVVWNSGKSLDYDIYTFSLQLPVRAMNEARKKIQMQQYVYLKARELCEEYVDHAIASYTK